MMVVGWRLVAAALFAVATPAFAGPVQSYAVVATVPGTVTGDDGSVTSAPAGYVIDVIAWDGVAPYGGPPWAADARCLDGQTCTLKPGAGLAPGQVVSP